MSSINPLTDIEKISENIGEGLVGFGQNIGQGIGVVGMRALDIGDDIQYNIAETVNNTAELVGYDIRYLAGNLVGLVDNAQDNFFQTIADIRTDVSNSIQLLAILIGSGIISSFILWGDEIMKAGLKIGGIEFL